VPGIAGGGTSSRLGIITEVMDAADLDRSSVDVVQDGARNMQNSRYLKVGHSKTSVTEAGNVGDD